MSTDELTANDRIAAAHQFAEVDDRAALAAEIVALQAIWPSPDHFRHGPDDGSGPMSILLGLPHVATADVIGRLVDAAKGLDDRAHRDDVNQLAHLAMERTAGEVNPATAAVYLGIIAELVTFPPAVIDTCLRAVLGADQEIPEAVFAAARRTADYWRGYDSAAPLMALLKTAGGPMLNVGEPWADRVLADLADLPAPWRALVEHATTAESAKPSAKWEARGRELLAAAGPDAGPRLRDWLGRVGQPRSLRLVRRKHDQDVNDSFDSFNATAVRGLVWLAAFLPEDPDTARVLGAVVETALRKVPGIGPRNPKVANAAAYALSRIPTQAALAQVARLATRVTFKGTLKELNAALDAKAAELGLSRDEVEELAVPTYGLTEVGVRVERFGDASAELMVVGSATAVAWRSAGGRPVKSPPANVRADLAEELAEFRTAGKDIDKMLSAQVERLDRQFLGQRVWRYGAWRERYVDHPLVGTIARRLIWLVDGQPTAFVDGVARSVDDVELSPAADAPVELWHPVGRDVPEVLAWRDWLDRHAVTQPFKQAHREVYLLTAAEEATRVYSNRFAAHVLRQHQFHALAAVRGWRNRLRLMVDDTYPPTTLELPGWGLRAEFWVEGIGQDYGTDLAESGAYLRITTDQVRFYPAAAPVNQAHAGGGPYEQWIGPDAEPVEPLPLVAIPPLVLSEVLRDVDLFVGVASVGNDPTWQDGGPQARFQEYWISYSFGELTETAQTRRQLLERIVPRLAIADRTTVEGRFLVVRGDLRTYRIHLGSGNILMSPNDQYLCIVPNQSPRSPDQLYLPFEGDRVLALILSKALLLARDTAITDPTIVSQIGR